MNTSYLLRLRAIRILTDGLRHSEQAIRWARDMAMQNRCAADLHAAGFTLREIALGAYEVAAL